MEKALHLEVTDEMLLPEGELDIGKASPLMMTGGKNGMYFCTLMGIDQFEPFGAMFSNGKDPLAEKYT